MPKKATTRKVVQAEEQPQRSSNLFDYLRFGESYTSLILGIIVVIISTILLLSFVHNKNINKQDNPQQTLSQKDIALPSNVQLTNSPSEAVVRPTAVPKKIAVAVPTATLAPKLVAKPTVSPTPKSITKPKVASAMKAPTPTTAPAKIAMGTINPSKTEYTVGAGDNLWTISEKVYNSGYNWVDIARANNLSNPSDIHVGDKFKLPKVEQKIATTQKLVDNQAAATTAPANKIAGSSYTVVKGDTLWDISVRAYGDGYQWQKIASTNNLSNPSIIHSGNNLKIPRG